MVWRNMDLPAIDVPVERRLGGRLAVESASTRLCDMRPAIVGRPDRMAQRPYVVINLPLIGEQRRPVGRRFIYNSGKNRIIDEISVDAV